MSFNTIVIKQTCVGMISDDPCCHDEKKASILLSRTGEPHSLEVLTPSGTMCTESVKINIIH